MSLQLHRRNLARSLSCVFQDEERAKAREREFKETVDPTNMLVFDNKSKFQQGVGITLKELYMLQAQSLERLTALEDNYVKHEELDAALAAKVTAIAKVVGKRERNVEVHSP